jgi:GxxExxY protein
MIHGEITGQIITGFYEVYNHLGYGFLERVYENSLAIVLRRNGLYVIQQKPIHVRFDGTIVGEYFADVVVEDLVI